MSRLVRHARLQAALWSGVWLAGCAPQTEYAGVATSPVTMVCDGGRSFTVAYADGFETAIVESEGRRLELQRIRTTLGMTPTPGLAPPPGGPGFGSVQAFPGVEPGGGGPSVTTAGTTGVRYGSDEALFISRNQAAVLQIGDETFSNCEVARA